MDGFKQRIIGAVIIVSLAVIFLPMLFDEPHEERDRQNLEIPEEPDFPEVRVDEPEQPRMSEPEEAVEPPTADVEPPEELAGAQPDPAPEPEEPAPQQDPAPEPDDDEVAALEQQPSEEDSGAPDSSVLEGSYLVQLGSFGSADNARALRDRVREEGMDAYTETISRDDETLNRVYAGPFLEKSEAEAAKEQLDEAFDLQTLVISGGD